MPGHVWYRVHRWLDDSAATRGFWVFSSNGTVYLLQVTRLEAVHFEVTEADGDFEGSPVFYLA